MRVRLPPSHQTSSQIQERARATAKIRESRDPDHNPLHTGMSKNRHKYFRWTPRTARLTFIYTTLIPAIGLYFGWKYEVRQSDYARGARCPSITSRAFFHPPFVAPTIGQLTTPPSHATTLTPVLGIVAIEKYADLKLLHRGNGISEAREEEIH